MCTVSYEITKNGYRLLFNRDEQRTRKKAIAPVLRQGALMPIDSQSGGTWIAVNQWGVTVALLNDYQSSRQPVFRTSRGQIIPMLVQWQTIAEVIEAAKSIDLSQYDGFRLVVFGPDNQPRVLAEKNNGLVEETDCVWPVSSSSYGSDVEYVRQQYRLADLDAYHRSHQPQKGPYSVCVHRDDVVTVSLTEVQVSTNKILMRYIDGSPCLNSVAVSQEMNRCKSKPNTVENKRTQT